VGTARSVGARVLVNDRVDVALAAGADGVHLAESSLPVADVRRAFPSLLVGASVHGLERAAGAARDGADFLVFGPVYETPSKRGLGPPQGLEALARVAASVPIP